MLKIQIEGYKEAKAILDELPNNMQKRMLLSALKLSARPAVNAARKRVPVRSGALRKQIRVVRYRDRSAPKSEVDVAVKTVFSRSKKKGAVNEYYGKFIHEGTRDPRTPRRKGRILVFTGSDGEKVFARSVKGLKATPFLEQAYGETSERIVSEFGDSLATAVERFVGRNFKKIE